MAPQERDHELVETPGRRAAEDPDGHRAGLQLGELADAVGGVLDGAEAARGVLGERPAGLGGDDPSAGAPEQVGSSACSSLRICSATAGCETCSGSAAAVNEPCSNAAQKQRSCCRDKSSALDCAKKVRLPGGRPAADDLSMTRDVVIVGGGIAGLSAAWRLRHRDILLLEGGDRLGGRMRSDPCGDYWLNYGAHLFPAPGSLVDRMATECRLETVPVFGGMMGLAVDGKIVEGGRVESYPFRLPLSLRERIAFARAGLKVQLAVRRYAATPRTLRVHERPDVRRLPRPAAAHGARHLRLRGAPRDRRARRARRGRRRRPVRDRLGGQGLADRAQPARGNRPAAGRARPRVGRAGAHPQPGRRRPGRRQRAGRLQRRRGDPRAARDHGGAGAARRAACRCRWPSVPPMRWRSSHTERF